MNKLHTKNITNLKYWQEAQTKLREHGFNHEECNYIFDMLFVLYARENRSLSLRSQLLRNNGV